MATIRPISITGANEGISNGVIEKQQKVDNDRFQPFEFCQFLNFVNLKKLGVPEKIIKF